MFRNDQLTKKGWTAVIIGVLGLVLTGGSILASVIQDSYSAQRVRRQRAIDFGQEWNSTVYEGTTDDDINIVRSNHENASAESYGKWLELVANSSKIDCTGSLQETFATSPEPTDPEEGVKAHGELALGTNVSDQKLQELLRIRSSLNKFLNFQETICLAYQYETADRKIMEQSTIPAVKHFGKMLKPYMDSLRNSHPTLWQPIYDVAELDGLSIDPGKDKSLEHLTPPQPD